jgi:GTP-binding protein
VREELVAYGGGLADKPELIGLNKADAMTPREAAARKSALAKASGRPVMLLSGATGRGVPQVLRELQAAVTASRKLNQGSPLPMREGDRGRGPWAEGGAGLR